jgi:hypothetical protein
MPNFIIGDPIPSDSNLIRTLYVEIPGGSMHEADPNTEVLYATRDGVESVVTGRHYHMTYVEEPNGFDIGVVEQAVGRLFLEAIHKGLHRWCCEMDARRALIQLPNDVGFSRCLTQDDLPGIPDGFKLAICHPEFLGYLCIGGKPGKVATHWGAYLYDFNHTMVLFEG